MPGDVPTPMLCVRFSSIIKSSKYLRGNIALFLKSSHWGSKFVILSISPLLTIIIVFLSRVISLYFKVEGVYARQANLNSLSVSSESAPLFWCARHLLLILIGKSYLVVFSPFADSSPSTESILGILASRYRSMLPL